jgi:RNA polymerase sigma-70 factor (ECF subfamily)
VLGAAGLHEHFFRHEYGKLVAVLSRRIGVHHIETIEDAVQSSLMRALEHWTAAGLPENPDAWLFRVAYNEVIAELRKQSGHRRILEREAGEFPRLSQDASEVFLAGEIQDDLLRMLFVCCDDAIPPESQLVLALKTLCGFSVREISLRLFTTEANIYKRLARARGRLQATPPEERDESNVTSSPDESELTDAQYSSRLPALHRVLYLLFTEGHLSSRADLGLRRELCNEAIRLTEILVHHAVGKDPASAALLALMHLHAARMKSRQDESGGLLLLEEQDRGLWDQEQIQVGLAWLAKSARGESFTRYHAEAGVAAEHCLAPSFEETRWDKVAECYELLERSAPSALHRLNRAIAVAEFKGPEEGLAVLDGFAPPSWLTGSYLWAAVLSDLHRRCGNESQSRRYRNQAFELAPTQAVKELLKRRLRAS